jgi:hypothetical protein
MWPDQGMGVWLVGSAGECAFGPTFDAADHPGTTSRPIEFNVSVLGWPRTVTLPDAFQLVEPEATCPSSEPDAP